MAKSVPEQSQGTPATRDETPRKGGGRAARGMALLGRHKRVVRLLALTLVAIFVLWAVEKTWSALPRGYTWHINWGLLVAGYLLLVGQELSFAFIWRAILARLGSRLAVRSAQQIYLGSEFVRYIPGNVWHVFTRIGWAEQRGVPRATGLASMTVELATKISGAALVFVLSLLFWPDVGALAGTVSRGVPLTIGLVGVPLLLIGLHPRVMTGVLNFGLRKLGKPPVAFALGYRDILTITLLWAASWLVAGVGFYLVVLALAEHTPVSVAALVMATGIYAIGWDIGFLSFVTPSGIGFREAVIAALLSAQMSNLVPVAALTLVIALVSRLLSTAAELVCVAGAHFLPGGRALRVENAQPDR